MRLIIARRGGKPMVDLRYRGASATRGSMAFADPAALRTTAHRNVGDPAIAAEDEVTRVEQSLAFVERATAGGTRQARRRMGTHIPLAREADASAPDAANPAAIPVASLSRADARRMLPDRDLAVFRALLVGLPASLLLWAALGWLLA